MNVTEILQFVDNLVFTETEQHLDDLQKKIIEEVFKGRTYKQIAETYDYDEGYIGDESRKLFKILSQHLGENINKSNFCWTLERVRDSSNCSQQILNYGNNNITWYSNYEKPLHPQNQPPNQPDNTEKSIKTYYDLKLAPKVTQFYGREQELELLQDWTLNDHIPLIAILGQRGTGKTTLVKRFIDINLQKFELIIWRNLKIYPSSVNELSHQVITEYSGTITPNLPDKSLIYQFSQLCREQKCLIVFDDVQTLFTRGEFAGKYQPQYQDYQGLFQMFTELEHQSTIILISQEQPPDIRCRNQELFPSSSVSKCWELSCLYNIDFLQSMGLTSHSEQELIQLIKLYNGNFIYLGDIAGLISNLFAGSVREFLGENNLVITQDMNIYLTELFQRLSPIEQKIVLGMSKSQQPVSREYLRKNLSLSSTELINGLQSLSQRYLIKNIAADTVMFSLDSVFLGYLQQYILDPRLLEEVGDMTTKLSKVT
ncbi:AAA family ATPase [Anabaenopsis arnoldii]|uniref:ATP-binding protein n=1 Tax=Anabaenopsis arnoldii TaxID=2152938 RepID=A0ABT5APU1_9CYAN|nr:AAA family ATPase [Anabaenopsis arnoldii]MDB9539343.1 ATP-binding protein [Anabaenopsis arnoldii]MDH6091636.1 ATP-binding protein [Anabaenopsis arnoldii]